MAGYFFDSIHQTTSPWRLGINTLTDNDFEYIAKYSSFKIYDKNETIIEVNSVVDKIYFIRKGYVRYLLINSDGDQKFVLYSDSFISVSNFFHHQPTTYKVEAVERVEAYLVERSSLGLILERENIRDMILTHLSLNCRALGWQIANLSLSSALESVSHLIYCYFSKENTKKSIKLSHKELSLMSGLHRVTITRTIGKLKKMGIVKISDDESIEVTDWQKLEDIGFDNFI